MKHPLRMLLVALIAAGVATLIVQRDRLRQIDRAELVAQLRGAVESRLPDRASGQPSVEEVDVTADIGTVDAGADAAPLAESGRGGDAGA